MSRLDKKYIIKIVLVNVAMVILSAVYYNSQDILDYNYEWIKYLNTNGILSMYKVGSDINYPPIFPASLFMISKLAIKYRNNAILFQLIMKSFAVVAGGLIGSVLIYRKFGSKTCDLFMSNMAFIVNTAMWGQTDTALCVLILLMFYYINKDKVLCTGITVAIMCLLKHQGIYFIPIYLLYIVYSNSKVAYKIKCFIISALVGVIGWVPFIVSNKDLLLPFRIYFGALGDMPSFSRNASNVFVILNGQNLGSLSWLTPVTIMVCIVILICVNRRHGIYYASLLYVFSIFMITTQQHERYIMYTVAMLIVAVAYINEEYMAELKIVTASAFLTQIFYLITTNNLYIRGVGIFRIYSIVVSFTFMLNVLAYYRIIKKRSKINGRA